LDYRAKLLIVFLSALAVFAVFDVGYSALNTVSRLDAVEAERDQWQRPVDILQALDLRPGSVVVDLGCGSGYFTLKLSSRVGRDGRVIAEDIRRLPVMFLWYRALLRRDHNVEIVVGEPADPKLPRGVDGVLMLNTYHEIADVQTILSHVSQSLVSGGRLVVVDRSPKAASEGASGFNNHEVSAERVRRDLGQAEFEIVSREDHFIERDPGNETWWLLVARKP
jgi:predicted methyltransferase